MVEFKVGPRGPKLMEINGRVWGSLPLAVMSGVDFPLRLADLYVHGPPPTGTPPQVTYRTGIRARDLALEVAWLAAVLGGRRRYPFLPSPGRWRGIAGLLGLLDPRSRLDLFAWDDPGPCLAELPLIVTKVRRKIAARTN
jgi:predicted ATP-grasp superfamily ATP-dependent carboligase